MKKIIIIMSFLTIINIVVITANYQLFKKNTPSCINLEGYYEWDTTQ